MLAPVQYLLFLPLLEEHVEISLAPDKLYMYGVTSYIYIGQPSPAPSVLYRVPIFESESQGFLFAICIMMYYVDVVS